MGKANFQLYDADGVEADAYTDAIDIEEKIGFSLQITVANGSSFSCSAKVQATNDGGTTWTTTSDTAVDVSSDGTYLFNISNAYYQKCRGFLDVASGSADVTIHCHIKK